MLGFLNFNSKVLISQSAGYDAFGIPIQNELKEYKCFIRESENLEPITAADGSQFVLTYYINIEGNCSVNVGDIVVINGVEKIIRSKKHIRDFDFNIIMTKLGV